MYAALWVFALRVVHVVPPSVDLSTLYPVIGEPPVLTGIHQERFIRDGVTTVALIYLGESGTVAGLVLTTIVLDGLLGVKLQPFTVQV